jgi:hypothetical protein
MNTIKEILDTYGEVHYSVNPNTGVHRADIITSKARESGYGITKTEATASLGRNIQVRMMYFVNIELTPETLNEIFSTVWPGEL